MSDLSLAQIEVQEIEGQLLVDSRLIADRLGIQHRGLITACSLLTFANLCYSKM